MQTHVNQAKGSACILLISTMPVSSSIPLRRFGKSDVKISALGLGGHHLGASRDEQTAVDIVHQAIDGGVTFFDNCWEYNRGKSEDWLGKGLRGHRNEVFLMTKVCNPWPGRLSRNADA
jgi:uncharacterized protein